MCDKIRKVWDVVPLGQPFRQSNLGNNVVQLRTNMMHTRPPSLYRAVLCSGEEMSTSMRWCVLHEEKEAKQIWVYQLCLLGVPIVGTNQPRKEWMWWKEQKACEKGWKWGKLSENPKMPHPQCGRSIKTCYQTTMMPKAARRPSSRTARALRSSPSTYLQVLPILASLHPLPFPR